MCIFFVNIVPKFILTQLTQQLNHLSILSSNIFDTTTHRDEERDTAVCGYMSHLFTLHDKHNWTEDQRVKSGRKCHLFIQSPDFIWLMDVVLTMFSTTFVSIINIYLFIHSAVAVSSKQKMYTFHKPLLYTYIWFRDVASTMYAKITSTETFLHIGVTELLINYTSLCKDTLANILFVVFFTLSWNLNAEHEILPCKHAWWFPAIWAQQYVTVGI